jgi:hypothetical protein
MSALRQWVDSLAYRQLRSLESLQSASLPSGRRLRGVELNPALCLGRDRQFYAVIEDRALRLDDAAVLTLYSVDQVQRMYTHVRKTLGASRRRRRSHLS